MTRIEKIYLPPLIGFISSFLFLKVCELFTSSQPINDLDDPGLLFIGKYLMYAIIFFVTVMFQYFVITPISEKQNGRHINKLIFWGELIILFLSALVTRFMYKNENTSLYESLKIGVFVIGLFSFYWIGNLLTLRFLNNRLKDL